MSQLIHRWTGIRATFVCSGAPVVKSVSTILWVGISLDPIKRNRGGRCHQVVDHLHHLNPQRFFNVIFTDIPIEIGWVDFSGKYGARCSETRTFQPRGMLVHEASENLREVRRLLTWERLRFATDPMLALSTKQGQTSFCAANIAYQNHTVDYAGFKVGLAKRRRKSKIGNPKSQLTALGSGQCRKPAQR